MRERVYKILVTGGAGFIGSAFVRLLIDRDCPRSTKGLSPQEAISKDIKGTVPELVVVDKLTYAGDLERLREVKGKYKFYQADICDKPGIDSIFGKERPDVVVNFAAETHVDRSIRDPKAFLETNILGTHALLDVSLKYKIEKMVHISSDEVYGDITEGRFNENSPLKPNSPYAASKAAADLLIRTYIRTHGLPAIIIRPSNNYGPWQYPEKLIPLAVLKLFRNEKVPVYAKGLNVREWLYVEDCAQGILQIMEKGRLGEIYNLGSREERQNIEVVKSLLDILKKSEDRISFVKDRPGHDLRYSLDSGKVFKEIGWRPKLSCERGLKLTVDWLLKHKDWLLSKWEEVSSLYK